MRAYRNLLLASFIVAIVLPLTGCGGMAQKQTPVEPRPFQIRDVGKSDVDMVAEVHLRFTLDHLRVLTEKLYRRNPQEYRKAGLDSPEAALARLFGPTRTVRFPELQGARSVASMRLAFDAAYTGDRVLALMEGLRGMVLDAYNGKQEFFLLDELDPQKLHNAARNVEIVVWKLSNERGGDGRLLFLTNESGGPTPNLSFERTFGKIIALHDSMAQIVADATNRRIKNVIQTVASSVFIGI